MDREARNGAARDIARSEGLSHPLTNEKEGSDTKALAPEKLKGAEAAANDSSGKFGFGFKASTGFYRKEGGEDSKGKKGKGKLSKKTKKKILLASGGLGGLGLVAAILIIFTFIGSFKYIHFATILRTVAFARFATVMDHEYSQHYL